MALTTPTFPRRPGPGAKSRRGFRSPLPLPVEPTGIEIIAAVKLARAERDRRFEWDARLETSAIAVVAYLWRLARGQRWALNGASARYGCSLAQLLSGLAPIMGWSPAPRGEGPERERWLNAHRKTLQRWLDWLHDAGLVTHTPQQDEEDVWWRTIIELHGAPAGDPEVLQEVAQRRLRWPARERRREHRGRGRPAGRRARNLTAVLRRARLSQAERRARGAARRRAERVYAERAAVRAAVCQSLEDAAKDTSDASLRGSTTSRTALNANSETETPNRGLTRAGFTKIPAVLSSQTSTTGTEKSPAVSGDELRWAIYREVLGARYSLSDDDWRPRLAASQRRVEEVSTWPEARACPRWRLIEAWTVAAHGPYMAAAGGFRLALWREGAEHHGARLDRALVRYACCVDARPPQFPAGAIAALAHFWAQHTPRQDGAEHGMAYDVQRFNELTKQMSAYSHVRARGYVARSRARAERRKTAAALAEQVNLRLPFRISDSARVRVAAQLLDNDHPAHQAAGRRLYRDAQRQERLLARDQRLAEGHHPGLSDARYVAACRYAERWGLPTPAAGA